MEIVPQAGSPPRPGRPAPTLPGHYQALLETGEIFRGADGRLRRLVQLHTGNKVEVNGVVMATTEEVARPVALTLEEARAKFWDFYRPEHGWIRYGRKPEREHPENVQHNKVMPSSDPLAYSDISVAEATALNTRPVLEHPLAEAQTKLSELRDAMRALEREEESSREFAKSFGCPPEPIDPKLKAKRDAELAKIERALNALSRSIRERTKLMGSQEFRLRFQQTMDKMTSKRINPTKTRLAAELVVHRQTLDEYLEREKINWEAAKIDSLKRVGRLPATA